MNKIISTALILILLQASTTMGQMTPNNRIVGSVDQGLTIKDLVLMPTTDNVKDIYAKAVEEELKNSLDKNLKWTRKDFKKDSIGKTDWSASSLDGNPNLVRKIGKDHNAQALLTANITRGPSGLRGQLQLYLAEDGRLIAEETIQSATLFETADVRAEFRSALERIQNKLPYQGLILSRQGQNITLNMGQADGLKPNDELTVIHIITANRHPKRDFLVSSEKEIIGRLKVYKVDKALSFASVILEKEPGVVIVGSKVLGKGFTSYPSPMVDKEGRLIEGLSQSPDQNVAFGSNPKEWQDRSQPQFGKIGLYLGNSFYNHNTNLTTVGGISASSAFTPNIGLKGEVWYTASLLLDYRIRQSVFSLTNNLGGSNPENVNMSLGQYSLGLKYNILMSDDFFGPKWNIGAGFTQTKFDVDNSTPEAYTSNNFGGLHLNFGGQFPLTAEIPLMFGAEFQYYLTKSLSEATSSGSGAIDMVSFEVFVDYFLNSRNTLRGEILFETYASKLGGTGSRTYPATSTSHRLTTFNFGYNWLF